MLRKDDATDGDKTTHLDIGGQEISKKSRVRGDGDQVSGNQVKVCRVPRASL